MSIDDAIRAAGAQLAQRLFDPSTARQAMNGSQNDLGEANQQFGLRIKLCEERLDAIERALRKAGLKL